MMTGVSESKHWESIFHVIVNTNLMKQNVSQVNGGTIINVDVSVKSIYLKMVMFGILLYVIVEMENI